MPKVIIIQNSYNNEDAIERLICYILDPYKAPRYYVTGHAVNLLNTNVVINDFKLIQNIYGKNDQRKVRHIIVSFADYDGITDDKAFEIECMAVDYFRHIGHQAVSAVHVPKDKGGHVHFHMAINTVNLYTGLKYSGTHGQEYEFFNYMRGLGIAGLKWEMMLKNSDY